MKKPTPPSSVKLSPHVAAELGALQAMRRSAPASMPQPSNATTDPPAPAAASPPDAHTGMSHRTP